MPNPATPGEVIGGRLLGPAATALAALVDNRVYPSKPTEGVDGDYVCYWRTGGSDGVKLSGKNKLKPHDIRIECVSPTQEGAEAIADAVAGLLDGWRDRAIGVKGCFAVGDRDEATLEDGRQVSGQTFTLHFSPKTE